MSKAEDSTSEADSSKQGSSSEKHQQQETDVENQSQDSKIEGQEKEEQKKRQARAEQKPPITSASKPSAITPETQSAVRRPLEGRPVIGKPIGAPVGKPPAAPSATSPSTSRATPPAMTTTSTKPAPQVGDSRATVETRVGAPASSTTTPPSRPSVGTPSDTRPTIGTPVGVRPSVGTPSTSTVARAATAGGQNIPGKPTIPAKPPVESKRDASRRNFLKLLAAAGGLVAVAQFGELGPYLQGSVKVVQTKTQQILNVATGQPIKTTDPDFKTKGFEIFVYPRTGNPNVDNDTFSQWVVIQMPQGLTAPPSQSVKDTITGDAFIALSRVCLHLWCLWNYNLADRRGECPCHGSQYVPGTGPYPNFPQASDKPPGWAVAGPASLQTPPNNQLPIALLTAASDGTLSVTGIVGQVGCGQLC